MVTVILSEFEMHFIRTHAKDLARLLPALSPDPPDLPLSSCCVATASSWRTQELDSVMTVEHPTQSRFALSLTLDVTLSSKIRMLVRGLVQSPCGKINVIMTFGGGGGGGYLGP